MIDVEQLRPALASRAHELATQILGDPNRELSSSHELRFGSKGSTSVVVAGPKAGLWFDFEEGVGGDLISLIQHRTNVTFPQAVAVAVHLLGGPDQLPPPKPKPNLNGAELAARRARNQQLALGIWQASKDPGGTLAQKYLANRGLELPAGVAGRVIRFHPACPFESEQYPAMITLLRNIHTNEPQAIQRTALKPDGTKIKRHSLGPKAQGAIKLSDHSQVKTKLTIGEGVETTLAGMMLGFTPAWAVVDADGLARFPVLPDVKQLTILQDNDLNDTGQVAAIDCSYRWMSAGKKVKRAIPNETACDFNDVINRG